MRAPRLPRSTRTLALIVITAALAGCPDEKPVGPSSRFDAVTSKPAPVEASRFCDHLWPASGDKARSYQAPPTRKLDGATAVPAVKGWRWLNAWATWCTPCVEEMGLLSRWRDTFQKDGVDVSFELMSIDESEAEPELKKWLARTLPGPVSWVKSPEDFSGWLGKTVGINPDAAIPIHVLVDPAGHLRCVRIGAVHAQDYGTVRALLTGG